MQFWGNSKACRRYKQGILLTMSGYTLALLGVTWFFKHHHPTGPQAYALAVLPALPILCMLGVVAIYLRDEKDEFQRWLVIRSMLSASFLVLAVTTVYGFLQNFTAVPSPPAFYVFILFWLCFGLAQCVQTLLGRRGHEEST